MIEYKRASTDEELSQILALQQRNLPEYVSSEEIKVEGFVTVHHDFALLKEMNEACAHIIATSNDEVIGYTLCMHPKFGDEIPVLRAMFSEIQKQLGHKKAYIVMGQVCVDKPFRKKGVFRKLYETMLECIRVDFERIVTEVDVNNQRSLAAHYGVGFQLLSKYRSDGRDWELIVLE